MSIHSYRNSWLNVAVGQAPSPAGLGTLFGGPQPSGPTQPPLPPPVSYTELNRLREAANEAAKAGDAAYKSVLASHEGHDVALSLLDRAIGAWTLAFKEAENVGSSKAAQEAQNAVSNLQAERSAVEADKKSLAMMAPVPAGSGFGMLAVLGALAYAAWRFLR